MSSALGLNLEDFAEQHLKITSFTYNIYNENLVKSGKTKRMHTLVIKSSAEEASCRFLHKKDNHNICVIYDARPYQCSSFPFWDYVMTKSNNFLETEMFCPGFNIGKKTMNAMVDQPNNSDDNSEINASVNQDTPFSETIVLMSSPLNEGIQPFKFLDVRFIDKEEIIRRTMKERKIERDFYVSMTKHNFDIFEVYPFIKGRLSLPED
jgi:Fe-S-cluster containining protein